MLGHGIVQGVFSTIRGGKFKTGFISGVASKISSATINKTPLSQADPFVKMSVMAILGGMASKASGGDFVQGAMSAMVVWLYNDFWDGIAERVAFGDRREEPSWFDKLVNAISKTNKSRQYGDLGLIQAEDGTIMVVDAKKELLSYNTKYGVLKVGIRGDIGKINGKLPMRYSNNPKNGSKGFDLINLGFNTFAGESYIRLGHWKVSATGYAGGLSLQLKLTKLDGIIGFSLFYGGAIKWSYIDD